MITALLMAQQIVCARTAPWMILNGNIVPTWILPESPAKICWNAKEMADAETKTARPAPRLTIPLCRTPAAHHSDRCVLIRRKP